MARKNDPYIYKVLRRETPSPRQQEFFRAEAANVAYGGARGGGKSWAMRRKLVMLPGTEAPAAAPDAAGAARKPHPAAAAGA